MNLPIFSPTDSPGSNFMMLLQHVGQDPFKKFQEQKLRETREGATFMRDDIPHGTTIVAVNYQDGVLMASDRRSTMGHQIADRSIEKVHPADRHSGISISGSAGFGLEMIRLFQLNLEHYEKVEGKPLSMEGKANQLAQMIRSNLGLAMSGFAVIPIFAGYDLNRKVGRIFSYDVTGGRSEKDDFFATGSGGHIAGTTIKLGWKPGLNSEQAIELAISSLYEAADEDSATGGPDPIRNIYPMVALITNKGYNRVEDSNIAERFLALIARKTEAGHRL